MTALRERSIQTTAVAPAGQAEDASLQYVSLFRDLVLEVVTVNPDFFLKLPSLMRHTNLTNSELRNTSERVCAGFVFFVCL